MTDNPAALYPPLTELEPADPKDVPPDVGNVGVTDDLIATAKAAPIQTHMPSHLSEPQREEARDIACAAAHLMLVHASSTHYTEGGARWEGIAEKIRAVHGHYPSEADCSSSYTWWLWNALAARFHHVDILNGEDWKAGYTGTLVRHGNSVPARDAIRGDAVLYGDPFGATGHVAMCVGHLHGEPYVISNGSEAAPFFLPYNYRSDVHDIRRYI